MWKKKSIFILVLLSELDEWLPALVAVGGGQVGEQDGLQLPSSIKKADRQKPFRGSPKQGQILPPLRQRPVPTCPTERFAHYPWPRAKFTPPLLRIHETEKLFYPNCQQTKLISTSPVTGQTIYDREKKWIFSVCFSRLFLMWF